MPIDSDSLSLLDLCSRCFKQEGKGSKSTQFNSISIQFFFKKFNLICPRACADFFYHAETLLQLPSRHLKQPLPIIPFDIVAQACRLWWDNLSQNSCIWRNVGLNSIPNHSGRVSFFISLYPYIFYINYTKLRNVW